MSVWQRVTASPADDRFEEADCAECGAYFLRYRAGRKAQLCQPCQQAAIREAEAEKRRNASRQDEARSEWMLISAPDREWWGSMPCFTLNEINASFGTSRYDKRAEYPFPPGCRFRHLRSGRVRYVKVTHNRYLALVQEER